MQLTHIKLQAKKLQRVLSTAFGPVRDLLPAPIYIYSDDGTGLHIEAASDGIHMRVLLVSADRNKPSYLFVSPVVFRIGEPLSGGYIRRRMDEAIKDFANRVLRGQLQSIPDGGVIPDDCVFKKVEGQRRMRRLL